MPNVIHSARQGTASVFDVVTTTASVLNKTVGTISRSVDMLDAKAELLHKRVTINAAAQLAKVETEEVSKAALEHAQFMLDTDRAIANDKDLAKYFQAALKSIESAIQT